RPVLFTNNDSAYATAIDLAKAGAQVTVVDAREAPKGVLPEKARELGVEVLDSHIIVKTAGDNRVQFVDVMKLDATGRNAIGDVLTQQTDLVGMSSGWNPSVHLFSQSRGKLRFDEEIGSFVPDLAFHPSHSAGACNGKFRLSDCLAEGFRAGTEAAKEAGLSTGAIPNTPDVESPDEEPKRALWIVPSSSPVGHGGKHFVDFQNDVTAADIGLAAREGYVSVEHLKRYTTLGMGTDQGKTSNVNALGIMAEIREISIPEAGHTTFRPPFTPLTLGAIAGHNVGQNFDPIRRTPMHAWHADNGAVFEDVGQWKRPFYYPKAGESMQDAINRECLAVRKGVGVLDASTLGKIDIKGPDAAEFLNMVYTNAWLKLGVGACRYGLMLNEHGMVMDDGVTTRIADDHFHMTTTTGNAPNVLTWLEEWLQTEWPDKKVYCTTVTEQWAVASLSGPMARDVLLSLTDIDLSANAFPFMGMREGTVAGIPARVYRISFTGESSFEINVPARYGHALWEALMEAGKPHNITPYGTEAMHVLRAERGFIIVGQETDGTITPTDLGMDWIVSKKKPDFLGKRSLSRSDTARTDRKQLVGLLPQDPKTVLKIGEHAVETVNNAPPMPMIGHVTSSYWSATLDRGFALALIREGRARIGSSVTIARMDGSTLQAKVVEPIFYDKDGERARA
ncbi:MAG: glycine cleavage T C-terminal barrel domain-containing protein, partial [Pseudomonadota bacterium]